MFVDTAKVKLEAGKGGDGAVSFRHEIYIDKGGPDGGDGGKGGSIIFRADKNTNTLIDFRFTPELKAENGKNGGKVRCAGRSGKDLIVDVPIGTIVHRLDYSKDHKNPEKTVLADLTQDGETAIIAKGGDGGFGNAHFKSSVRQAPRIAEVGEPGEAFEAEIELKLLADIGLVGLPNAGKSTFLSRVSNATPKIADYEFTTLTPQLGVATIDGQDLLIADIPGLIEGAANGKGLGIKFLRHVERTSVLLHLIDAYSNDAGHDYQIIRHELEKYGDLASRPEIIALTKSEGLDADILTLQTASIRKIAGKNAIIIPISSHSGANLPEILRELKKVVISHKKSQNTVKTLENAPISAENPKNTSETADLVSIPTITLKPAEMANTWVVEQISENHYRVSGPKIEKFARRTDLDNYASLNRLRDIMKKLGIRGELTTKGAKPDSIIEIAGKKFTLVEDW